MSDVQENHFTTSDEIHVTKDETGYWQAFDFEWDLELFRLPPTFDEQQVRLVCAIVARRMRKSEEWGEKNGRSTLQHELKNLLGLGS